MVQAVQFLGIGHFSHSGRFNQVFIMKTEALPVKIH